MGERKPDPALIPDFRMLDGASPPYLAERDQLVLDVRSELVVDNLLDLSHTSYLHEGVLGNDETVTADIEVRQDGDTVYVSRTAQDVERPSFFDLMLPEHERVDKQATIRWDPPGCLLNDTTVSPLGDDPRNGTGIYGVHLVTPIDERRTRYLFTAVRRNPHPATAELDERIERKVSTLRRDAFEQQDAVMIAAQQERIEQMHEKSLTPVLLASDQGLVRKDRVMRRLRQAEQTGAPA
jgi:vanillate O-demethylase monooxygenase subunit